MVFRFDEPFRLVYLLVTPGAAREDEAAWLAHGRPAKLRVVMSQSGGATNVETIDLKNEMGAAKFNVATSDVIGVKLEILDSYGPKRTHTALGEVEFFGR